MMSQPRLGIALDQAFWDLVLSRLPLLIASRPPNRIVQQPKSEFGHRASYFSTDPDFD